MQDTKKIQADQFWKVYFPEWLDTEIDESHANEIDFWEQLENALESVDIDTIKAVMLSIPLVKITSVDMYERIVKIAKHVWDQKRDGVFSNQNDKS